MLDPLGDRRMTESISSLFADRSDSAADLQLEIQAVRVEPLDFFTRFNTEEAGSHRLNISAIVASQISDSDLQYFLLAHLDRQNGIVTCREVTTSTDTPSTDMFSTGVALIRDARGSKPLADRLPGNHPAILMDNMLLRTLTTIRAIKYTLQMQKKPAAVRVLDTLFKNHLLEVEKVQKLYHDPELARQRIQILETQFNTKLVAVLHENDLDQGVDSRNMKKGYGELLQHYRNLSAALDPAPTQVTLSVDGNLMHVEVAQPITHKTAAQRAELECMATAAEADPAGNFHSVRPHCYQAANAAFKLLLEQDHRRVADQMRRSIAPTVKNGYYCHSLSATPTAVSRNKSLRCATIAYIGKGATRDERIKHASENLRQLAQYTGESRLHATLLNTDSAHEQQDVIVDVTKAAINQPGSRHELSYVPVNWLGITEEPVVAQAVVDQDSSDEEDTATAARAQYQYPLPTAASYASRVCSCVAAVVSALTVVGIFAARAISQSLRNIRNVLAAEISQRVDDIRDFDNLIMCASGRDRTGVNHFLLERNRLVRAGMEEPQAEELLARGTHVANLATLACPGSEGVKPKSVPEGLFSPGVEAAVGRKTADTNKACSVDEARIKKMYQSSVHDPRAAIGGYFALVKQTLDEYVASRSGCLQGQSLFHSYALTKQKVEKVSAFLGKISKSSSDRDIYSGLTCLRDEISFLNNSKRQEFGFCGTDDGQLLYVVEGLIDRASEYSVEMREVPKI